MVNTTVMTSRMKRTAVSMIFQKFVNKCCWKYPKKKYMYIFSLQPHQCAQLTSSVVELDVVCGCHGDVMARMTARIGVMKRGVRKLVRLEVISVFKS